MSLCREKIDWLAHHSKGHHSSFKYLKNQMNRYVRRLSFEDTPIHKSSCKFYRGWVTVFVFMIFFVTGCGEQTVSVDTEDLTLQKSHQIVCSTTLNKHDLALVMLMLRWLSIIVMAHGGSQTF